MENKIDFTYIVVLSVNNKSLHECDKFMVDVNIILNFHRSSYRLLVVVVDCSGQTGWGFTEISVMN